ncbi:MAG TPA: ketoacyl reductase [Ruminococcus sp.]|nr:ketoacyl reductase [Ruminococcus sp.]
MKALVTGASSGIGWETAIYLSELGYELIITGRNKHKLMELKRILKTKSYVVVLDLAKDDAPQKLYDFCKDKDIDLVVNNAGFGLFGEFDEIPVDKDTELIKVNVIALNTLTKLFLRDFKKKNSGRILNVASSAGFMPGPLMASYYASKSYVVRLSEAINEELRRSGSNVKISVLCPGPVATEFNNRAGVNFSFRPADCRKVARYAVDRMFANELIIVPTLKMKSAVTFSKFVPAEMLSSITYKIQKKKF